MNSFYRLLRRGAFYRIFIWTVNRMPWILPFKRLCSTNSLLAFMHPRPAHAFHVVLIPKKAVRSLPELDPKDPFLPDLIRSVQDLVNENRLSAYRLVVNGGGYQEFPHLHFHLISDT